MKLLGLEKKIESEVFTRDVLLTLGYMMNRKLIKSVDFPISKGKEAYVFRATAGTAVKDEFLAVKIYMIQTSRFKHMFDYISGDPRFSGIKRHQRDVIYAWTRKEFRNLKLCETTGVHAPKPYFFRDNILVMSYIGDEDGSPLPLLKEVGPPKPEKNFKQVIEDIRRLYSAGLIHADISEFNIIVKDDALYLIDIGQGILLNHPMAETFLRRDVENVVRYFSKFGIKADVNELIEYIKEKD